MRRQAPAAFLQRPHLQAQAQAAAEFAGSAGVRQQVALLDDDRALLLDALDRRVAHVALAHA